MPSTVHTLIKSAYKTFQANPGMATLLTPKAHIEATPHQPKAPPTNLQCTPIICQAFDRRKDDPVHIDTPQCTPCDYPKAKTGMSHTHFRSHLISSSDKRGRSRMLKTRSHYNFNPPRPFPKRRRKHQKRAPFPEERKDQALVSII